MRKSPVALAAVLLAGLASVSSAQFPANGYIGVFSDQAASTCCIINAGGAITFYSYAHLDGATAGGITGAEYRIDFPHYSTTFFGSPAANPASTISLGNPLNDPTNAADNGGNNIAFAECQTNAAHNVLLHTFSGFNGGIGNVDLEVKGRITPSNPNINCALMILCDAPVFTAVPLTITKEANNGVDPIIFKAAIRSAGPCPALTCLAVGVTSSTWTTMKGLYR